MSAHTPGPWVRHPKDGIPAIGIDVGDGGPLLPIVDRVSGKTRAEANRNAALISAAPDLLAAARQARDALAVAIRHAWEGSTDRDVAEHKTIKQIDAAIAKAITGGAA